MRVNDACRFTGISRSTLYLLIASGDIEIIKLGASTLVVTESLRRFINENGDALPDISGQTNGIVVEKTVGKSGQDWAICAQ
ncbi:helix-turn-helix domain-containing protein [Sphingopyxis sp. BSNA05]|uniref:helix-turn-helix domain-containing protein n=1 Tax=Sphingopyxis sp. BSNA05 TaxID=1236614 RepID=UPI0020B78372|nr:helix-turn-helix domain-containing protein [Sphingopyxis sp. BSNA05]